ncbi:MAG: sugar ABC transporter permease [Lachnospiraceae bacterium]|nr:sugar ABC transporter permease [Lachnospiraceae bacterium]
MEKAIKKYFPVFALPTILAFVLGFIIPFILGIYLSFCKFTTLDNAEYIGLENYKRIFGDERFIHAILFTVMFTIVSVISLNIVAFAVAKALTRGFFGTNFFRTVFFMPNVIGGVVAGYILKKLIDTILTITLESTMTFSAKYGFWALVIAIAWQQIGYLMIIYIAGIQNVPPDLIEAAKIDGASKIQTLFKVTIPMLMPSITICVFLTLTNSFKLFDQNLTLTNGDPSTKSEMLALNIFNTFYGRVGQSGVGQAKAVVFTIMVAIVALIQLSFTRRKEVQQ